MNVADFAGGFVAAINPWTMCTLTPSAGYTTAADGTRTPTYGAPQSVRCQVQALQYNDLMQVDGLGISGDRRAVYLHGNWNGVVRADQKGGDLLTMPDGTTWLCVFQFEDWGGASGWVKICVTRQVD